MTIIVKPLGYLNYTVLYEEKFTDHLKQAFGTIFKKMILKTRRKTDEFQLLPLHTQYMRKYKKVAY